MDVTRIYLAGPDVFAAEADVLGRRKTDLCAVYGFTGLFPLDSDHEHPTHRPQTVAFDPGPSFFETTATADRSSEVRQATGAAGKTTNISVSARIYDANLAALRNCDAVIANLTPFRGVSADVGTVFELAYAIARGTPVFAYTNVASDLADRVALAFGRAVSGGASARILADDGMEIENFGLTDNLMIVEAIRAQGWDIVAHAVPADRAMTDLEAFEACLVQVRAHVAGLKPTG